jgi:hypothetical protein
VLKAIPQEIKSRNEEEANAENPTDCCRNIVFFYEEGERRTHSKEPIGRGGLPEHSGA